MSETILLVIGILLFIAGFYTGVWIQRHSYHIREVPKLITTEKIVEVEKPIVIQVPRSAPSQGAQLAIMNNRGGPKGNVLDPIKQAESERMTDLISQMPEV